MDKLICLPKPMLRGMLLVGLICTTVSAVAGSAELGLDHAVAEALQSNPSVAVLSARLQALQKVPPQMASLPDPRLSLNALNLPLDTFSLSQEAMTQIQLGISQDFPAPGKLGLRAEAATQEVAAAEQDIRELKNQLRRQVRDSWWKLFYLDRALEGIAQSNVLLHQIIDIAATRYQVGQGQQQEMILAELELSKLEDKAIQTAAMREYEEARLIALLGRETDSRIQLPRSVALALAPLANEENLLQRALELRPELSAQRQRLEAAQTRIQLAQKDYSPDYRLGAVYGWRSGENPDGSGRADMGSILFSMNLPLYSGSKQDQALDQRRAEWLQQKYQLQDRHNQVRAQLRQAISSYEAARRQTALYEESILPQARQTVDAMLAGYEVGRVDFPSLMRSETALYNYETQYWQALTLAKQAKAQIDAAVGVDIGEENNHE